ncbi:hypothetical protein VNO78_20428 [Psophocarpus tetragonolobus]|uniref:Uncharacterized protein n=1 Tax=Psophocarpus tetragonolobus TaxID=3891 RepID=A0AAN9XGQ6_PSOTE
MEQHLVRVGYCSFFPSSHWIFNSSQSGEVCIRLVEHPALHHHRSHDGASVLLAVLQASVFHSDRGNWGACVGVSRRACSWGDGDDNGVHGCALVADIEVAGGAWKCQQRVVATDD